MRFAFASLYARFYGLCHDLLGFNPPGFGRVLRGIKHDGLVHAHGLTFYFKASLALSYARLLGNKWNEPETHVFVSRIAPALGPTVFIDIGANIGEMVVDFARLPDFSSLVAYEPDPVCADIIRANAAINHVPNVTVVTAGVSAKASKAYLAGGGTPQAQLSTTKKPGAVATKIVTLDEEAESNPALRGKGTPVVLVDVEGHELEVLKGAKGFIAKRQPLIIFEFNHISRAHFGLKEVQEVLGKGYKIRRLNRKGLLDDNLEQTWNCVAVPLALAPVLAKALRKA